jgi:serine/threonine protein kinase/Flp pilus assembly protein TadD
MQQENGTPAAPPSEDGLAQALEDYLEAAEAGTAPPRAEFLARHPELAEQLDGCLAALRFIGRAGGTRSVAAGVGEVQPSEPVSGTLGDFRIVREVGRGGMGVVYEAEQISLSRRVALKVLPFAATMDPRQLQRFHNEARAAASLDHPHIVHVHAVGCERAVHFYAMQFIDGQTLASVIADLRRAGGKPVAPEAQATTPHVPGQSAPAADTAPRAAASTERGPRDRSHFRRVAEWGIQAAEALDHAHQLGIVHRDIKPANLLVDGRDGLWVTDFGLAQVQSDARLTMTGDLVGTLRYMSPEQALAKRVVIDHRTDVYSLGATLYELLTLEPAVAGNDRQELLRQIAFEEPPPPRRVNKGTPVELGTITLKAMEKNPADRYATAKELADDLRRWLAEEPIRARPAGVVRRLRKWGRRHRAAVAAAAALVVALLLLGGVALWRELARRDATEAAVSAALDRAELLRRQEQWDEALAVLELAEGQLKGRGLGALRHRAESARRDVDMLKKLEAASLQRAATSKEAGLDYAGAGRLYAAAFEEYGLDLSSLPHKEAAERFRASAICDPLINALDDWALVRDKLNQGSGGPLRAVANLADDDPWRRRLREAGERPESAVLERFAEEPGVLSRPSANLVWLASALIEAKNPMMAERLLRQAQASRPADFWINFELAFALAFNPTGSAEETRFYQAALALRPRSPLVYNNLGMALAVQGKLAEAEAAFREAIALAPRWAVPHYNLARSLAEKNDLEGAIAEYQKAVACNPEYAEAYTNLGRALQNQGKPGEAIVACRQAIALKPDAAVAHHCLGDGLRDRGDLNGAIAEYRTALALDPKSAKVRNNLGGALFDKGDVDGAVAEFREAIALDPKYAFAHYNLGKVLHEKGDLDGAIAEYKEAIRVKKDYAEAHCNLAYVFRDKGQFAEALTYLRRGHGLGSKDPRWRYPSAQWVKQFERLAELDGKLRAILCGKEEPASASERAEYADVCCKKHLYAAAARLYREAITAQADLVASPAKAVRYNAACAGALAGCGAGADAAQLTDAERAGLRQQARDWLRADLDAWRGLLHKDPSKASPAVAQKMQHWLRDTDFGGVRGPEALAQLPGAEREGWRQLWADVAATLARAQGQGAPAEKKAGPAKGTEND